MNDFGFTAVDESEITQGSASAEDMYNAVAPLLDKLAANSEKDYIHWPDREGAIEAFRAKLKKMI